MPADEMAQLFSQHAALLTAIHDVYAVLAVCAFVGLALIGAMCGLAAWSVKRVTMRQQDLEGKFSLLIDVLLQQAHREKESHGTN